MSPVTEKTSPSAEGRRGVRDDAYTWVDGPREVSVEVGTVEPTEAANTDDRKVKLGLSLEVEG
jgi:hypothetical protein